MSFATRGFAAPSRRARTRQDIAAPVLDALGRCLASLSLVGLEARFEGKRLARPLRAAVAELTTTLADAGTVAALL